MLKVILSTAVASLIMCSAAYAGTLPARSQAGASDIVQIKQGKDHGNRHGWGDDDWRDRRADQDYDDRYRNWHRYSYRPDDWDDRGCAAIGPIWYCP
jgi:hypothetical protein